MKRSSTLVAAKVTIPGMTAEKSELNFCLAPGKRTIFLIIAKSTEKGGKIAALLFLSR